MVKSIPVGRRVITRLIRSGLRAADPAEAVLRFIRVRQSRLILGHPNRLSRSVSYPLDSPGRIILIGAGKAATAMAGAVVSVLGSRLTDGLVVTQGFRGRPLHLPASSKRGNPRVKLLHAGHPLPNGAGQRAAAEMVRLVSNLDRNDLVIFLLSGGASALLPLPVEGISLRDKQKTTDYLLRSGATIQEVNAVRKHLSRIKGGQLAARCHPARVVSLILSDVIGSPLDAIGSGPMAPDPTTFGDVVEILKKHRIWKRLPSTVRLHLTSGSRGLRPETPKKGDPMFRRVKNFVIGDNQRSLQAVAGTARKMGFNLFVLSRKLHGEARDVARRFGRLARRIHQRGHPVPRPACVLAGGELTVTVTGRGKGGRCQELALAAVREIAGLKGTTLAAFGTDGTDGPTDAAGAVIDHRTLARAQRQGLDPDLFLSQNNSYAFLKSVGGLMITGPTGTNVSDIYLLIVK